MSRTGIVPRRVRFVPIHSREEISYRRTTMRDLTIVPKRGLAAVTKPREA
jgi:hypothetical protein